jgi:hypothetical protein
MGLGIHSDFIRVSEDILEPLNYPNLIHEFNIKCALGEKVYVHTISHEDFDPIVNTIDLDTFNREKYFQGRLLDLYGRGYKFFTPVDICDNWICESKCYAGLKKDNPIAHSKLCKTLRSDLHKVLIKEESGTIFKLGSKSIEYMDNNDSIVVLTLLIDDEQFSGNTNKLKLTYRSKHPEQVLMAEFV